MKNNIFFNAILFFVLCSVSLNAQIKVMTSNANVNPSLRSDNGSTDISTVVINENKLYQNAPNPFSERTTIYYELSETVKTADIYIFNMQGSIVKKIAADRSGRIEIQGSELQAGMYLYSLVADGKEVDTKRMILTK